MTISERVRIFALQVAANAAMSVAGMVGGFIEAAMSGLPSAWPCVVAIACAAVGFFWTLFLLPNVIPEAQAETTPMIAPVRSNCCSKIFGGLMSFLKDTASVFVAVGRKRQGNRRGILIAMCLTMFFVAAVIDDEDGTYFARNLRDKGQLLLYHFDGCKFKYFDIYFLLYYCLLVHSIVTWLFEKRN